MPTKLALGAPAVTVLALLVAACGGQVDRSISQCSYAAVTYCQSNGCPATGPTASTSAALDTWCQASSAIAPRVTAYGTCTLANGQTWAINVRATTATGDALYLLYDPSSAALLSVTTIAPGGAGDAGAGEQDYGFCGQQSGIVTCTDTAFTCGS